MKGRRDFGRPRDARAGRDLVDEPRAALRLLTRVEVQPAVAATAPAACVCGASPRRVDFPRAILENSRAIVYIKDVEGRYLFVNSRFESISGLRPDDVLGKTDHELWDAATADAFRANDLLATAGGGASEIEELLRVPGSDRPRAFVSVKEPLLDATGRVYAICGISTDITERKRIEESTRLDELRYRSLVDATAAMVWSTPASGEFEYEQPGWSAFTGQTFDELKGWGWLDAVHPEDRAETVRVWSAVIRTRETHLFEHRVRRRDGQYRDTYARAVPILAPDGSFREWMGLHIDVTDRKAAEKLLRESQQRHAVAMAASGTGTYRLDFESGTMEWDDQMRKLLGASRDVPPSIEETLRRIHPDDRQGVREIIEASRTEGLNAPMEFRVVLPDGGLRWLHGHGRPFGKFGVAPSYVVGGCYDITKLKLAEERLSHRANHDVLTGMPNRNLLHAVMESFVSEKSTCPRFAFLLLDLDRFKEINDAFGHDHGDAVLQELNPRLNDAVTRSDLIARLGGDEFGILVGGAGRAEAVATAQAILASLQRPIPVKGQMLEVGASVGIALYPDHGRDVAALLRVADIAMYSAKRARSGWTVYQAELDRGSPRRLNMVGELRQAVEEDQLLLHYQPKVDLRSMRDAGAEALVRWRHPRDGMLPPGAFIPLAEETGLIRPLSRWVLDRALSDGRDLAAAGASPGVAVNLAPDILLEPNLVADVVELLRAYATSPRRLTIEVTEGAIMKSPARAKAVLHALHELGVRISIDDFGTGYSSLAYLKELPVDEVKVDRSFVKDMAVNPRDACIVRSVIDLGHNLGLRVVAEGVEDEAALNLLRTWGCDVAQGFHLSPPLATEGWLRRCRGEADAFEEP
ncbi:sensor domain-containing protein [Paludisphaera mucosa]|uniref:EAL domain-containing protein n=1 Tax=Paludisphaera mucosa TaxID=3030827 RepID=A0ABT6FAL7_9BACT|nr:EAL domain-containing protein [Paludisphaera mucosa]MDG3004526.1 EAL domain-containing protein [Paludisphaera mucosa]